jgi:hypothetical protein
LLLVLVFDPLAVAMILAYVRLTKSKYQPTPIASTSEKEPEFTEPEPTEVKPKPESLLSKLKKKLMLK